MFEPWCPRGRCRGMSRPLLKLGGGSGDILSDVLRVGLEFVIRPPLEAGPCPGSGRSNAHG